MEEREPEAIDTLPEETPGLPWRRRLVLFLMLVVSLAVLGRVHYSAQDAAAQAKRQSDPLATSLNAGQAEPTAVEEEPSPLRAILPFLTEGGIAMLLGIALGVATRLVAKVFLLALAGFFIALQFLVHKGIVAGVDWGAFAGLLRDFVLNISSDKGLGAILQHKLPAAGGLTLGYYIGLKRG